jgi:hypothetical protein
MEVRAKFRVESVTEHVWGKAKSVKMGPQYDPSIPEDQRFHEATPSGSLEMLVTNEAALAVLRPGAVFYLDFTPAPDLAKKSGD